MWPFIRPRFLPPPPLTIKIKLTFTNGGKAVHIFLHVILPPPSTYSRDDNMIREAMQQFYDNEYDVVVATVRFYAIALLCIITLIVSVIL